jgi:hypothetical protein
MGIFIRCPECYRRVLAQHNGGLMCRNCGLTFYNLGRLPFRSYDEWLRASRSTFFLADQKKGG